MLRVNQALAQGERRLNEVGVTESRLEARLLLQHVLGRSREWIYGHPNEPLTSAIFDAYTHLIDQRRVGEPLAYLTGSRGFYGCEFAVDRRVLVPRPETETLLEAALAFVRGRAIASSRIVDVGTGSGILAVSLAAELPSARMIAVDRSLDALAVASDNARRHQVADRIAFIQGDLLKGLAGPFDLIVANLPYVPTAELDRAPEEIRREPRLALDGGAAGLDLYPRLFQQAAEVLAPNGALFAEIGWNQGLAVSELARSAFPGRRVEVRPDLEGRDRVVIVFPGGEAETRRSVSA